MKTSLLVLFCAASTLGLWVLLGVVGVLDFAPLGFRVIASESSPAVRDASRDQISREALLDEVLAEAVTETGVAYELLVENEDLEAIVAGLAHHGPRTSPQDFTGGHDEFAYYINAYNALVLYAVASEWPIESVHDVRGWIEPRAGFGFFYGLQFKLDGERLNLYDLEHRILLDRFEDARVHAAINCASRSCPPLKESAYKSDELDASLDAATRAWVGSSSTVTINDAERTIELNAIFSWFSSDFERDAAAFGGQPTVLAWIEHFLPRHKANELNDAQDNGYDVIYADYDWSINQAE